MSEKFREKFDASKTLYKRLGSNAKEALETFLVENNISFLAVTSRIKDVESFLEKIERKNYEYPFEQIEDICGIRIICYYQSDIEKICQIIEREFDVQENQDKEELLQEDQFGYRSYHFIVKIKDKWLEAPNYRGLETLKVEIQVRTVLMHAWAEIEHKLAYKQKIHIPNHLKRKLYRISAKLEEADEQFEDIKNESIKYRDDLTQKGATEGDDFYKDIKIDLDSLQSFLDYKFPNRKKSIDGTRSLLNELLENKIDLKTILASLEITKPYLNEIEKEIFEERLKEEKDGWAQVGIVRKTLDLTNDNYYNTRYSKDSTLPSHVKTRVDKWRKKINKPNKT